MGVYTETPPADYIAPNWPGLSLDFGIGPRGSLGLYSNAGVLWNPNDMVLFILLWSILLLSLAYSICGVVFLLRWPKYGLAGLLLFMVSGFLVGLASGACVGGLVASLYAGLSMATWVPLCWGVVQLVFALLFSYSQVVFVSM